MDKPVQVFPRRLDAPGWARYLVLWPHGLAYAATAEDAATMARASGRRDHRVLRVVDGQALWPIYNPRALPRCSS